MCSRYDLSLNWANSGNRASLCATPTSKPIIEFLDPTFIYDGPSLGGGRGLLDIGAERITTEAYHPTIAAFHEVGMKGV